MRTEVEAAERLGKERAAREARAKDRAAVVAQKAAVEQWTRHHRLITDAPSVARMIPEASQAPSWPSGHPLAKVTVVKWPCPANELASKVLAGVGDRRGKDTDALGPSPAATLLAGWRARCEGMQARFCSPMQQPPKRDKICFVSCRCLRGTPEGRNSMRFVKSLADMLTGRGGVLVKGQPGRHMYDEGRAVLRIHRQHKTHLLRPKDVWLHLGFGRLTSSHFHCWRLVACVGTVFGDGLTEILLKVDNVVSQNLWDAIADIDVSKNMTPKFGSCQVSPTC